MGSFTSEFELVSKGSLLESYKLARLFTTSTNKEEQIRSCNNIIREYAVKQLAHMPGGTRLFDAEITEASNLLKSFLISNEIQSFSLPSALYTSIKRECNEEVEKYCAETKRLLLKGVLTSLYKVYPQNTLPSEEETNKATKFVPTSFQITTLPKPNEQPDESFIEHQKVHKMIEEMVYHYKLGTKSETKSLCIVGPGGVGKTNLMCLAALYCMSQGLFVISTTLTGKRGAENAGKHIHTLFGLHGTDHLSPVQVAEKSVRNLLAKPHLLELLQRTDVICLDELGQCSSSLLFIIDMILRRIRKSTRYMGGIMIVATADDKQCKPIKGLPPFISPSVMTHFVFYELNTILRTLDSNLQQIQRITRMSPSTLTNDPTLRQKFKNLLLNTCNFVKEVDDDMIPEDSMYCFPRNEACFAAQDKIIKRMKRQYHRKTIERKAIDKESTRLQMNPVNAKTSTSKLLDKSGSKLPRTLTFYPYALFEFTYNDPKCKFFKSQLCMLLDEIPSLETIADFKPIQVYAAPPGINVPPSTKPTAEELLILGWTKVLIGKHPERKVKLRMNGHTAIRQQYALRHRIAVTVHGIMGSTVNNLAIEVGMNPKKAIWEAAMVVVLLSRTRTANGLYFIGEPYDVVDALWNALLREDQFKQYVSHVREKLCDPTKSNKCFTIDAAKNFPFRSKDIILPTANTICCYILISTVDNKTDYIGWTNDLSARFNKHNSSSYASEATDRDHLKPWMLFGYISGFSSKTAARQFESRWQRKIELLQVQLKGQSTPDDKLHIAESIETEEKLCSLKIGSIQPTNLPRNY